MTTTLFVILLGIYSTITGLIVQVIKQIMENKKDLSYNIIAIIAGLVIGFGGTFAYYGINLIPITLITVIYAILLGLATALTSMLGYDKVKQTILQLFPEKKN